MFLNITHSTLHITQPRKILSIHVPSSPLIQERKGELNTSSLSSVLNLGAQKQDEYLR